MNITINKRVITNYSSFYLPKKLNTKNFGSTQKNSNISESFVFLGVWIDSSCYEGQRAKGT